MATPALANNGTWEQLSGGATYWGNDDYACSGNNYDIYWHNSQSVQDLIGEDCESPGESFSVPIYSQQGWDCDEIFLFTDLECVAPQTTGSWEREGGQYWGNDDYACSGNNYEFFDYGSQYTEDLVGEDCVLGDAISIPVYSQQGWDCDEIFLFEDFVCE
ncbi:MAG: hypothetical protein ACRBN8_10210 [Nannocystales bacterium]